MDPKDKKNVYDLPGGTDVPPCGESFSLEEILAEFGGSLEQTLLKAAEAALPADAPAAPAEEPPPTAAQEPPPSPVSAEAPSAPPAESPPPPQDIPTAAPDMLDMALPQAPRPVSLEEIVGSTVGAVMDDIAEPDPLPPPRRRGLFSHRKLEETEELYDSAEAETEPAPEPKLKPEPIGPEPELFEESMAYRAEFRRRRGLLPAAAVIALVPTLLLILERSGAVIPRWTGEPLHQATVLLGCLAAVSLLCRHVFFKGIGMLLRGRCTSELLISVSALAAAADCAALLLDARRTAVMPYTAVSCLALVFALWGGSRESGGLYDTFRAASLDDEPPYLITETARGACKQQGSVPGFYSTAMGDNAAVLWQTAFLPLVLAASFVFAGLSSLGQGRGGDFFLNWSAILAAGATFAMPLCWGLPYGRLARHLQKAGCAVAGWAGAERISRKRRMILTDTDLFPPGSINLSGVRVYGEELPVAVSHAASMVRAAGCGLERLFDELLHSELGRYEEVCDFSFYKEGGWSGTIRGESILLGTASFMRKMEIRLPGDINLKTGLFLSVDRHLVAVFAVKYNASENADFALRMMERSHITPILASRDPNIVPELLRRKFHKSVKVEFPDLTTRVALSEAERDRGLPRALIFREGLLPYAETVVGSRRLCRAVRRSTLFSFFGSAAGALLTFYLVSLGQYELLTPLALEVFLLLWTLPVLLIVDWASRY